MPFLYDFRARQVRLSSRILLASQRVPFSKKVLQWMGRSKALSNALVGHRRAFATRAEADEAIRKYGSLGHADPKSIKLHVSFGERARPSDYPALYHLGRLMPEVRRLVDIGGNAGNVYYCYSRYLQFDPDFEWVVHDLPAALRTGRELAAERGETRLRFADTLDECAPADLVLFSGSLHYFDETPPALLKNWAKKPRYILINRSPVTYAPVTYGVQDTGLWMVVAAVMNRDDLVAAMDAGGYALVDEWPIFELSLRYPLHPQSSAELYMGSLFQLREA